MAHLDGEIAMAKASDHYLNTPLLLSSWSTTPLEEVAEAAPNSLKLF
jgi:(S)-2-hydroxy-acid oxidase